MMRNAFQLLYGLAVVGVVWSIRHDRSLTSSASSDRKMERAIERLRHRRSDSGSQVMTQAERLEFLATHNTIRNDITGSLGRSQPTPAGMMKMYWSAELEASALSWALECHTDLKHGQSGVVKTPDFLKYMSQYGTWIGQNLYKGGGKPKGSSMVKAFANETFFFTFADGSGGTCMSGKMCGHYTQVVWQSSFLVGCGYAQCGNVYIGACNYMPGGNYQGAAPYKSGTPCSLCAADTKYNFTQCEGQLCVPADRCSPVKSCAVEDTTNCLCSESSYSDIISRLLKDAGAIHVASPVVIFGLLLLPLVVTQLSQGAQLGYNSGLL